ncbi:hypothetical protein HDU96_005253 [Phlyctochytrium bullatum]|nr:hypothetical protein HDU96_005253 [Phlyctochytrium bullatum]
MQNSLKLTSHRPFDVDLLRLSLAAHYHAPAIQFLFQYFEEYVEGAPLGKDMECPHLLLWNASTTCAISALRDAVKRQENWVSLTSSLVDLFDFDYVYPEDCPKTRTVVYYADVFDETFIANHQDLMALARKESLCYVLRYRPISKKDMHVEVIGGYGVELAIKSTEYSVIDDRDLSKGTNLAHLIDDAPIEHKLDLLYLITRDLPIFASSLNTAAFGSMDLKPIGGAEMLYLNGLQIRLDTLDLFKYNIMRPAYGSQLRYVRKNIFNVVLFLDLSNFKHLDVLMEVFQFVERDIPLRFGLVPAIDLKSDDHASVKAGLAFMEVSKKNGRKSARAFVEAVLSSVRNTNATLKEEDVTMALSKAKIEQASDTPYDVGDMKDRLIEVNRAYGIDSTQGGGFLNGKFFEIDDVRLRETADPYDYLMNSTSLKRRNTLIYGKSNTHIIVDFLDPLWSDIDFGAIPLSVNENCDMKARGASSGICLQLIALDVNLSDEQVKLCRLQDELTSIISWKSSDFAERSAEEICDFENQDIASRMWLRFQKALPSKWRNVIIINGRAIPGIDDKLWLTHEDLAIVLRVEQDLLAQTKTLLVTERFSLDLDPLKMLRIASAMKTASFSVPQESVYHEERAKRHDPEDISALAEHHVSFAIGDETFPLKLTLFVNPLSALGQKAISVIKKLVELTEQIQVKIVLVNESVDSDRFSNRFYRFVLGRSLDIKSARSNRAQFFGIPKTLLLTVNLDGKL